MLKSIKIALAGMTMHSGNLGVDALAISTIFCINQIAKKNNWNISYYSVGGRGEDSETIMGEEIHIKHIPYLRWDHFTGLLRYIKYPRYFSGLWQLRKMDCLLDISGGDSYSDIYGAKRFYNLDSLKKLLRIYKIKQLMLPQTIGPFSNENVVMAAKKSIERTSCVMTRDSLSYKWVVGHTRQKNVFELVDVALFMPFERMSFCKDKIHVGLNVSALLWHGGYTQNNQFGLSVNYQELIRQIITQFIAMPNVELHLIPHVIGTDAYGVENDYHLATLLQKQFKSYSITVAPYFFSPIDAKNYISGMDFFVGARMHSCIAAFSSRVPVVPMAYSRKFNGLFVETLNYPYLVDMKVDDNEIAARKIMDAFENRDTLLQSIRSQDELLAQRKELIMQHLNIFLSK